MYYKNTLFLNPFILLAGVFLMVNLLRIRWTTISIFALLQTGIYSSSCTLGFV